jgi:hypothetical protein
MLWALAARPAAAQVFVITGGSSSISHAHGGALEFRAEKRAGRIDVGTFGKPSIGFSLRQHYRGLWLDIGDQPINFVVPTDVSGVSHYFLARGVSAERKLEKSNLTIFAGTTSTGFHAPFLNVARSQSAAGAILYERRLSPSVRWVSRNLVSRRLTSLQSLEWAATESVRLAMTSGLGSGEGYWASTIALDKPWVNVDAGYTRSGDAFRRVIVPSPQVSESDREKLRIELIPSRNFRFVVSRDNYLSPIDSGLPGRATVNGFGFWTSVGGSQFNASLFRSSTRNGRSQALALGTRRAITRRVEAGLDFLSNGRLLSDSGTLVATIRETINARLSLNQVVTRSGGQTSIAYGGRLLSNLVTVSAEYQTVFLPFVATGPGQFKQVLLLGLHFQLPFGMQIHGDTVISPDGKVRYTSYATTYSYRAMAASPGASASGGFYRNVVRGRVADAEGNPLEGAAVRIGKEIAFTDSQGRFFLRLKRNQAVPFAVATEEFLAPGRYQVVSAPDRVSPALEGDAPEYSVVIRRLPNDFVPPASDSPEE